MQEKELPIDTEKHVCYSKAVKKVIQDRLRQQFDEEEAKVYWEKIQQQYVEYLKTLPYLGGRKNGHNGAGGTYDCIALFAYYEVLGKKPTIEEIYEMNNAVLLPSFRLLGKIFNVNHPWQLRLLNRIFAMTARRDRNDEKKIPDGYKMRVEPFSKETGIHYCFEQCPIAEFAKTHGLLEIMPALCNSDYPAFELLHAGLIRNTTCSNGTVCDYWIVGDESSFLREYPKRTDVCGYLYNGEREH